MQNFILISDPVELQTHLKNRRRLERPPLCPQVIFNLMIWFWEQLYQYRPTFATIKDELETFLETQHQQKNLNQET